MNLEEMLDLFSSEMLNLPLLKALGFVGEVRGAVAATAVLPEGYVIEFHNQRKRSITVKLFDVQGKGVVSIYIRNTENRDIFSLISWVKLKKIGIFSDGCHLIDYEGNFAERLSSFLKDLSASLSTDQLISVLLGDSWDSIPFNWAGMR